MLKLFSLALVAAWMTACGSQHLGRPQSPVPPPVVSSYQITRDVPVSPANWPKTLLADIYVPEGAGPHASVLLIHGGAWKRGDRAQVEGLAKRIAARGYLVVNTTYRLVPDSIFPAQLQDVQQAAAWMRTAGAAYGIDSERIGSFGYSAGGHLAALVAAVADDPILGLANTRMKAVVAGGTPSDLTLYEGGYLVPNFMGGPKSEKLASFKAASPALYVKLGHPPLFQYHATLDGYVPFEQATRYKTRLDAAGVPNELFVIKGHGHISAFFADGDAVQASLSFLDRYLR